VVDSVESLFDVQGGHKKWLPPFGGFLNDHAEYVNGIRAASTFSKAVLFFRKPALHQMLQASIQNGAEQFCQHWNDRNGSIVFWQFCIALLEYHSQFRHFPALWRLSRPIQYIGKQDCDRLRQPSVSCLEHLCNQTIVRRSF
jgi:hypothetical protein